MVQMILLGGFLGAGKTTTMIRAAKEIEATGERVSVITNDQADNLVDTQAAEAAGLSGGEVAGGCFCCKFEDLVSTTIKLVKEREASVVLAEAVGSCTDLMATVVRPLRRYYANDFRVAPLTILLDPQRWDDLSRIKAGDGSSAGSVAYLFNKQLEEADIIALNKVDLIPEAQLLEFTQMLRNRYPHAEVIPISALTGQGLGQLTSFWTSWRHARVDGTLDIDYDTYADAEAQLGWLNATLEVSTQDAAGFQPGQWVGELLDRLGARLAEKQALIGHVKMQLTTIDGVTSANLVRTGAQPNFRFQQWSSADEGQLVVNARVAMPPAILETAVRDSIEACNAALKTKSRVEEWTSFRPARPVPIHRLSEA
jgi:Ni2+-binding GTPase involved in maturation of urease and hydrogenase